MTALVQIGLCWLAVGTLLGWPVAVLHLDPEAVRRVGIAHPRRLLQMHVDVVIMSLILIAVGAVVPDLPVWIAGSLVVGAVVNPLLFLPLAFREAWSVTPVYRVGSVLSFAAMSVGTVGAAVVAVTS